MNRRNLSILFIVMLFIATLLPVMQPLKKASAEGEELTVNAEILYLREGPGLSYPIIETLKEGESLVSISKEGDWHKVRVGQKEGWVASWLVKSATQKTAAATKKTVISKVDALNLRAEPSLSAAVLTKISSGTESEYIRQEQDWIQIQYEDYSGWVFADYVTVKEETVLKESSSEESKKPTEKSAEKQTENDPNTFTVNVNAVNIRKKADLTSKKLGVAAKDQKFTVISRNHNWVEIEYEKGKKGWIYSFYGTFTKQTAVKETTETKKTQGTVTIIYNGTNLRESASTASNVVTRADAGRTYTIVETEDDWYKVALNENDTAYVANWVVTENSDPSRSQKTTTKAVETRKKGTLKGLSIVLDAGHGGNDRGTTGVRGTDEKDINLLTVELLKSKLQSAGATVIMTRESDVFVDLRKRVAISHQFAADAFISIHYDALEDSSVHGFTTYYTNSYQKELAEYVHAGIAKKVSLKDRGSRFGDYLVLRENRQNAILLELGYLSNPSEERAITTDYYREQASLGIYQGLLNYFDSKLEK
ncbi:N-acetylmuramoyl-L-alanine amidase [Lysinibacillus sp. 2017]|uniref:N-acetylmuramoyl-L-alanine amidase n=1 Tax=unclassified Lysinibacillus TaxID=2636778 RepID=UPI000D527783|nr:MULTISPECIES: N-acetylmuramoyl-L-alanine amidase [unclassified Lysinibacillus]AWE08034.1 N-acetylmuramoyl-L-alanine amidase [Lysinibacillus sp. 2017]TGN36459.1 N-acetylmuramoyl-L-alanine amidase [Lysinibacillus sp. S2017]